MDVLARMVTFVRVVEAGSMSAAGKQLSISIAAVSLARIRVVCLIVATVAAGACAADGAPLARDGGPRDANDQETLVHDLLALTQGCSKVVSPHPYEVPGGTVDICALAGAIYFHGDMAIDCDGRPTPGKCPGPDPTYQPATSFTNLREEWLAAAETPYYVLPGDFQIDGLDRQKGGNVAAIIYQGKVLWAVFGDVGPDPYVGEASYAAAVALGIDPDPAVGGAQDGVTYVVFLGTDAVPVDIEDRAEAERIGVGLATRLIGKSGR